ncbi:MAG: aldo/keto reductase [Rhodobacter sp.]|nr:aldo/keto reductase [Rhodobacter sp.]
MKRRELGRGGPKVFPIGVGAMSFADFYGATTESNSFAILDAAMAAGVNHIDTANVYGMGRSEETIGSYLKSRPEAREFFCIATKGSIRRHEGGKGNFVDNSPEQLEAALDASLKRLGVDAVDLIYVHRRDPDVPIEDVTETLAGFVRAGKAHGIGYSEIAPTSLRRAHAVHPVTAVQSEYSLATRSPELGLVQTCAELGVALVAFSPVGRSLLTDNPLSFEAVLDIPFLKNNPRFTQPNYDANIAMTMPFRALAADMGVPAAGLANAWLLAQGDHVIPIPGTRSVTHFQEILQGAAMELTSDDLAAIDAVLPVGWAHGDRYNTAQWAAPERYC